MSLVPFHPQEGREIVLRHRNAIVVRELSSQRLEIRGLDECPTCHRPLRSPSPTRSPFGPDGDGDYAHRHEGYVDPNYFRMLRASHHRVSDGSSSPLQRFFEPLVSRTVGGIGSAVSVSSADEDGLNTTGAAGDTDGDGDGAADSGPIGKDAFSQHYFKSFFVEERELGRGGKGVVLLVRHEIDGLQLGHFACKRVPVGDDHAWLKKALVEVELLAKLSHPNLVSYRHVWLENVQLNRFGPSVACAFILQQYCNGGDLQNYVLGEQPKEATKEELKAQIRRRSKGQADRPPNPFAPSPKAGRRQLQFDEIYSLFRDITSGLAYLHASNYIHRDLKPSNCLLHREGRNLACLISDFGEVQPENVARSSTGTTGTISYCAPEVLQRGPDGRYGNFTTKSDIFSLGMILHFLCFGGLPYRSANSLHEELEDVAQLRAEICDWRGFHFERRERPDLPSKLYQLLNKMLDVNPAQRPSASEVLLFMRTTELGMDGYARSTTPTMSPAMGMATRRLQSFDAAVPSGTPVPDPVKQAKPDDLRSLTTLVDELDEFAVEDADDASSPMLTAPTSLPFALIRNHENSRSKSPELGALTTRKTRSANAADPQLPGASKASPSQPGTTPLLMPPPSSFLGEVQHRMRVALHHALVFAHQHTESLAFSFRTTLFLVKMIALSRACWPFTAQWAIGAPLMVVAALDLGLPIRESPNMSPQYQLQLERPRNSMFWVWNWRISMLLLALHTAVLWMASRSDVLCPGSHKTWKEW